MSAGCAPRLASMPWMARFMCASRQVVGLDSWPKIEMSVRLPAVGFDELLGLHEHAARAAAGVVDAALVGFEHLDQHADDAARRVELAAELAFGLRRTCRGSTRRRGRACRGPCARSPLKPMSAIRSISPFIFIRRDAAAGVVARQLALEVRVVALDGEDGVVDQRGDVGAGGLVLEVRPARLGRHPEDALGGVLVAVFEQAFELLAADAVASQLGLELVAAGLEGVGDVLEEEQAEDDVLVLGGVDLPAQGVGGLPEGVGVGEVGAACFIVCHQGSCSVSFVPRLPAGLFGRCSGGLTPSN